MRAARATIVRPAVGTFSPLSIPWQDAYWASGPVFQALGLSNGASLSTWPTETGTGADMALNAGTAPLYLTPDSSFNNRPGVSTLAATAYMLKTGAFTLTVPWTVVAISRRVGGNSSPHWAGAQNTSAANAGLSRAQFNASTGISHTNVTDVGHIREGLCNGASSAIYTDGNLEVTGTTSNTNTQRTVFARANIPTSPLTGVVTFVGYLDRALTTQERTDLVAWSQSFYGTP